MATLNDNLFCLHPVFKDRVEMMQRHIKLRGARVLEIGAYDRPTFVPNTEYSRYLDYRTYEDLVELGRHEVGRDITQIPPVDYVAKSNILSKELDRTFDLVVGNHVVEHVPNLLEWLIEVRKILNGNGFLFLSVPDRRYTFDYLRAETNIVAVLRRFADAVTKPTLWDLLDARYLERPALVGDEAWHPEVLTQRLRERARPLLQAFEMAREEARLPYCDIHCSIFTSSSFTQLFNEMEDIRCNPFHVIEVSDVAPGRIEFHALLRVNPDFDEAAMPLRAEAPNMVRSAPGPEMRPG